MLTMLPDAADAERYYLHQSFVLLYSILTTQ
jgi:hypothetical protein